MIDYKLIKRQETYFYIMVNIYLIINIYSLLNSNELLIKMTLFLLICLTIIRLNNKANKHMKYIKALYFKISNKKSYSIFSYTITTSIFISKILIIKLISTIL